MTPIELGLIFTLPVLAVYLTSRVISFDDLTCEGSFGIGGAVLVTGMIAGLPTFIAVIAATCAGAISGALTGLLYARLKINNLICGIIVTTGLFSLSLNLAGPNASLSSESVGLSAYTIAGIAACALFAAHFLLRSEIGYLVRALGQNSSLLIRLGKNPNAYRIGVLALANALTATAGALFVKWTGYFSVFGNAGTLIIALSSLIIAEVFSRKLGISFIIGAFVYQLLFSLVLELDVPPSYNSLIKALLVVGLLWLRGRSYAES